MHGRRIRADFSPMSAEFRAAPIPLARQPAFRLGAVEVTPATSEVTWGDTRETLQPKVMQVLVALATRRGEVVSLDDLIAVCWGGRVVGDDAVQRCIARIRRLAERTDAFAVETIPRVGYRLAVNGAPSRSGASARRRAAALGALALLAVAGCAAAFWSLGGHTPAEGPRVEVEVLRAVDGGPAARFAEVLRDDVVSVLNQSGVQTTADADGRRVLHRPGADLVLKGSVSRQGEQLSVRIFLEDARSDLTLWSGRFDRPVASSQALADEVAVAATETIYTALEPGRYAGRKIDPETLALYIRGSELVRSPQPARGGEPRQAFEQVVARAPGFAAGHALLAITLASEARRSPPAGRPHLFQLAEQQARRAIELDPSASGAAYDALYVIRRTREPTHIAEAEDQVLAGLKKAPDYAFLNMRECRLLTEVGRARAAVPYCQRALALRPLAGPIGYSYARTLSMAGAAGPAREAIERAARRNPDHASTRWVRFEMAAFGDAPGDALALLRNPETQPFGLNASARSALETYIKARLSNDPGDIAAAASALRAAAASGGMPIDLAVPALTLLGRRDDAYALLNPGDLGEVQVFGDGGFLLEPVTAPLRADPRFWPVAARIGLATYWQTRGVWPDLCEREIPLVVCKARTEAALAAR